MIGSWALRRNRVGHTVVAIAAAAVFQLPTLITRAATAPPAPQESATQRADAAYRASVEAAARRDETARRVALADALAADPDHAAARAALGETRLQGEWAPAAEAAEAARRDERLAEYAERLAKTDDTLSEHRRLARWCDVQNLGPEARKHWLAVLIHRPDNREALRAIDSEWRGGRLVSRDVIEAAEAERRQADGAAESWRERIERALTRRGDAALDDALAELDAHASEAVVGAVASLPRQPAERAERTRRLAAAFFEASYDLPDEEVTTALGRLALRAADATIRDQATEALAARDPFDTVPRLLSMLCCPIDSDYEVGLGSDGEAIYVHRLSEEGAEEDRAVEIYTSARVNTRDWDRLDERGVADAFPKFVWAAVENQIDLRRRAQRLEAILMRHNADVRRINERVIGVLTQVTDWDLGDQPRDWWDDWRRYTGYDVPPYRPERRQYETNDIVLDVPLRYPPPPRCECFVAGTVVWTRTGTRPIETLRVGDLVLSRDRDTGGLTYRPVLATTVREPSPIRTIRVGDDTIRATVGHPFWVIGRGWRMASELQEGDVLDGVNGPQRVAAVEDAGPATAHNLVVEGAANYHVGTAGWLVHDNTTRGKSRGLLVLR